MSGAITTAEAGRRGAAKRWADPANRRIIRIGDLTPEQRALVLARVEALRNANARAEAQE